MYFKRIWINNFPFGKLIDRSTTPSIALTPLRKLWLAWKMQALGRF
jgi:hypothetical protein